MERSKKMVVYVSCIAMALIMAMTTTMATMEEDEQECAELLTNLASCIPYVSGDAKKPTPQCCEDTQKVKSTKPKCLCVLIKESTDPSMGLPVNTTLALQMPAACNIDAKVSNCPTLLNIPADSPDAKIFKLGGSESDTTTKTDATPTSTSSSSSSSSPSATTTSPSSDSKATSSTSDGTKIKSLFAIMAALIAWMFLI